MATKTPIDPGVIARVAAGIRYAVTGSAPEWFGPQEPLQPLAPPNADGVAGRQFDYPVGFNTRVTPRVEEAVSFSQLRALSENCDVLRLVIETRKDQLSKLRWTIRPDDKKAKPDARCKQLIELFQQPDKEHDWDDWLRMLLEDLFVLDAPTLYVRRTLGEQIYALEPVDGSTIKRVIDATGRTPMDGPAYQQVLKGVPAIDYTLDELIYKPRNVRTHKIYGYSPVEQIVRTVNLALRRTLHVMEFYTSGSVPDALASVPKEWNPDQIAAFQRYWDLMISDDLAARRKLRFIPDGVKYVPTKDAILKDEFDEWLARIVCYAFSVSPQWATKQMNRATAETAHEQALQEGIAPVQNWVKGLMNRIIKGPRFFGYTDLTFDWEEEEAVDPLVQAQINQIYVQSKVVTPDEVRADLGKEPLTDEQRELLKPPPPPALMGEGGAGQPDAGETTPQGGKPVDEHPAEKVEKKKPARALY